MPGRLEPQLATPAERPPEGERWVHEIKLDGYRMLCRVRDGEIRFFTRTGKDWTARVGGLTGVRLAAREAWIDGEVVVQRPDGTTDFQALQNDIGEGRADRLAYFVFDLLWLDGEDLRDKTLLERKELLRELLSRSPDPGRFRFSEHIRGHGEPVFRNACRMALEGTISKRADSRYRSGRMRSWLKNRCLFREEVLIGGFTSPSGSRLGFGALLVGTPEDGRLRYLGRVGTGFTERTLKRLYDRMRALERDDSPFDREVKVPGARVRYVEPRLVATISFAGWTEDGRLRHTSFEGLREDVEPESVDLRPGPEEGNGPSPRRGPAAARNGEAPPRAGPGAENGPSPRQEPGPRAGAAPPMPSGLRISNPDRIVFPEAGITKRELASYYLRVADLLLPHISNRLLTLVRCPKGTAGACFHQKHVQEGMPEEIRAMHLPDREGGPRAYITDAAGLIALIQMGVVEIHPGGSRIDRLERPDRLIFDLDPSPEMGWERVVEAALTVRAVLGECGLRGFVRTTGGKGLHVVVPIQRRSTWAEARTFCRRLARLLETDAPSRYTSRQSKARRLGRIYVDWLRNTRGATAVASYVVRARPGAPIATPVAWNELLDLRPDRFDVRNIFRRLEALPDPWEGFFRARQSIDARAREVVGLRETPREARR